MQFETSDSDFSKIPEGTTELIYTGSSVGYYSNLPSTITTITFRDAGVLKINGIPNTVTQINIKGCNKLRTLDRFPSKLETLIIGKCLILRSIGQLPDTLTHLEITDCEMISRLTFRNPDFPHIFKKAPEFFLLPESITYLDVSGTSIENLVGVPKSVTHLMAKSCRNLKSIEGIPDTLFFLNCSGCQNLPSLKGLPDNLHTLICDHCVSLLLTRLPKGIKEFRASWVRALPTLELQLLKRNLYYDTSLASTIFRAKLLVVQGNL